MNYLLDTNVISELAARLPKAGVVRWVDDLRPEHVYLSVITVGEIRKGIARLPDSKRKQVLDRWLMEDLLMRFDGHILPLGIDEMLTWGVLTGELAAKGVSIPAMDSLIAATAAHHRCILVTRNGADFQHTGVPIINPWQHS